MRAPPYHLIHIFADPDCLECEGTGILVDYEGYPRPMPANEYPCDCIDGKWGCTVEYFYNPHMPGEMTHWDRHVAKVGTKTIEIDWDKIPF